MELVSSSVTFFPEVFSSDIFQQGLWDNGFAVVQDKECMHFPTEKPSKFYLSTELLKNKKLCLSSQRKPVIESNSSFYFSTLFYYLERKETKVEMEQGLFLSHHTSRNIVCK